VTNGDEAMNFSRLSNYLPLGLVAMGFAAKIAGYAHLAVAGQLMTLCGVTAVGVMATASIVFVPQRFNVLPKSKDEEVGADFDGFSPPRQPITVVEQLALEHPIAPCTACHRRPTFQLSPSRLLLISRSTEGPFRSTIMEPRSLRLGRSTGAEE
jgi:hypothetical protein